MELQKTVEKLVFAAGASGAETEIAEVCKALFAPYGEIDMDALGNVCCTMRGNGKYKVHLDAHMDEIGLCVIEICDGFLKTAACGGIDRRVMDGVEVLVHGKETLYGVVTSIPPHLQKDADDKKCTEEILIDMGLPKAKLESLVALGDRVTIKPQMKTLLNGCISAPALDDRAGIAALLLAAEELSKQDASKRPDVTFVCSTREETTESGAKVAAYHVDADYVIAVDVSFALTPDAKPEACGKLFGGVMIGYAPSLTYARSKQIEALAKAQNIPYQIEVMGEGTGTNCDVMGMEKGGRESALLSIPLRYMHTGIEVIALEDLQSTGLLLAKAVLKGEDATC